MKKTDDVEEMLQYMRDKYHEEFTYVDCMNHAEYWQPTTDIRVEPAAFPGERVNVRRNKKTGKMQDGYLALKVNAEVEKEISAVAFEVYGENKVFNFAQTLALSCYTLPDMSASDFLRLKPGITWASIWVTKDSSGKDEDVETFRQVLKSKGYYLTFNIIYIEKESFSSLSEENQGEYHGDYANKRKSPVVIAGRFAISDSFEFRRAEWR